MPIDSKTYLNASSNLKAFITYPIIYIFGLAIYVSMIMLIGALIGSIIGWWGVIKPAMMGATLGILPIAGSHFVYFVIRKNLLPDLHANNLATRIQWLVILTISVAACIFLFINIFSHAEPHSTKSYADIVIPPPSTNSPPEHVVLPEDKSARVQSNARSNDASTLDQQPKLTGHEDAASVIDMPPWSDKLKALFSNSDYATFRGNMAVTFPIEREGKFWVGNGCAPHSCESDEAMFVIDEENGSVWAALLRNDHVLKLSADQNFPTPLLNWEAEKLHFIEQKSKEMR